MCVCVCLCVCVCVFPYSNCAALLFNITVLPGRLVSLCMISSGQPSFFTNTLRATKRGESILEQPPASDVFTAPYRIRLTGGGRVHGGAVVLGNVLRKQLRPPRGEEHDVPVPHHQVHAASHSAGSPGWPHKRPGKFNRGNTEHDASAFFQAKGWRCLKLLDLTAACL